MRSVVWKSVASVATLIIFISSATAYNFWDQGLVTGTVNTAFTDPAMGSAGHPITYSYCLFPPPDPYTPSPAPPTLPNHFVINMPVCSFTSPTTWSPGTSGWAQNGSFGASRYWVLDINNENAAGQGAYSPCNQGPPDYSLPRSAPGGGVMGFTVMKDTGAGENFFRAHLVLNLAMYNPCVGPIPFMAIGAHDTRGNGGLVGALNPTGGAPSKVSFKAKVYDYKSPTPDPIHGAGATFFRLIAVSQWQDAQGRDVPRMLMINLFHDHLNDGFIGRGWNWPLQQAFYFPGADIAYMDVEQVPGHCSGYTIPAPFWYIGQEITYDIDLQKLFKCASDGGLFRTPMPSTSNVMLRAVHWALEGVGSNGWLWVAVHNMQMHN